MFVELSVVEQRYAAVLEVTRDGVSVAEVAERHGVSRQSVHTWTAMTVRDFRAQRAGAVGVR